ncbi:hypothetical protein M3Y98_00236400 [Aphelenchoides besseyi]|nr:hypothetical protein M3Y98_00236400 [Aphelenchoides besseyi]
MGNSTSANDREVEDTTIKARECVRFVVMTNFDVLCSPAHSVDLSIDGTQTLVSSSSLLWTPRSTNKLYGSNINSELCSSITQQSTNPIDLHTIDQSEMSTINFKPKLSTNFENIDSWSRSVQQTSKISVDLKSNVPLIMSNANQNQHPDISTLTSPQKPFSQRQKPYRRSRWCGCC